MRRLRTSLLVAASVLALNGVARADCAGSELLVDPPTAAAGQTVQVTGRVLRDGICYDTGGCLQRQPDKQRPSKGATLQVVSADGTVLPLGEFAPAGDTYDRVKSVRLPDELPAGPASLQAVRRDGSVIAETQVVVRDR